jgi:hypothetical protein
MRIHAVGSILCVTLAATLASGGGTPKEGPYKELETSHLDPLLGDWEAGIATKDGWEGTLRGNVSLKRNHPEVSYFHAFLALKYDLKLVDKKTKKVTATAVGAERISLIPFERDRQRFVQLLRDFQLQQKEFYLDVIDYRPDDKKALKGLADMAPTKRDTAGYRTAGQTWTLEVTPIVLDFLPKKATSGQAIDWDARIVWNKVKSK